MKKFCALLLILASLAALVLPVSAARKETNVIVLNDCEEKFGNFTLDTVEPAEGDGCVSFATKSASFANAYNFDPVDLSQCDAIAFEIYVSDASLVAHFGQLCFEITSAGVCDDQELAWHLHTSLSTGLEEGWNTVYLSFNDGVPSGDPIDLTRVNYFRIFALEIDSSVKSEKIMFDNFRAAFTGGYDYSGMKIDGRSGDHKGENIVIAGMEEPDFASRTPGNAADPAETDPADEPGEMDASLLPVILGCSGAAVVIVIAVLLAVKKKKK